MTPAYFLEQVFQARPAWRSKSVDVQRLVVAWSNLVFRVSCGPFDRVLLRIYGSGSGMFDRAEEVQRARYIADRGFGPKVLLNFEEGRVEEWLEGRTPSHQEMRVEAMPQIARTLRRFHERTGFNHHDLHHNNMLIMQDGDLQFLDFEYAGTLDPACDIAIHFNMWTGPQSKTGPYRYEPGLYPTLFQRRTFCEHYLGGSKGKGTVVDDFLQEIEKRRHHVDAWWGEWAEHSHSEFSDKYLAELKDQFEEWSCSKIGS